MRPVGGRTRCWGGFHHGEEWAHLAPGWRALIGTEAGPTALLARLGVRANHDLSGRDICAVRRPDGGARRVWLVLRFDAPRAAPEGPVYIMQLLAEFELSCDQGPMRACALLIARMANTCRRTSTIPWSRLARDAGEPTPSLTRFPSGVRWSSSCRATPKLRIPHRRGSISRKELSPPSITISHNHIDSHWMSGRPPPPRN